MDIEYTINNYMDIMTWENCLQFRLLAWTSFIGQFIHPVGGEWIRLRVWIGGIVILASYKFHFVRVY